MRKFCISAVIISLMLIGTALTGCGRTPQQPEEERPQPLPTSRQPTATAPQPVDEDIDLRIFSDKLNATWENWSYDADIQVGYLDVTISESQFIVADVTKRNGAVMFGTPEDFVADDYTMLQFAIHGGEQGGQLLNLSLIGADGKWTDPPILIAPTVGQWSQFTFALEQFGSPQYIKGIVLQSADDSSRSPFFLDDLTLVRKENIVTLAEGPALSVNLQMDEARPINPHIYGLNFADDAFAREIDLPLNRWGGNAVTRYNYQVDVSNRAADWYFLNVPNGTDEDAAGLPDSNVANGFIAFNQAGGTDTIMTVPLIGWTPKGREWECGFALEKYGEQAAADVERGCGNGIVDGDKPITQNDPTDTSIAIGPAFVYEWVRYLVERFDSAENNGVRFYSLDNEPMLWHHTHRDVHPEPVGYDELLERTIPYAEAVRSADPSANILGPTVWGWTAYFYSAIDAEARIWDNAPDRSQHGNTPLVEWYLQQLAAYEAETGTRLLDYLDLHFYPQAAEVALNSAGGAARQALRTETTRNLWDTDYVDPTWIDEPIYLIPRMRDWVDTHYPGTKIALTEYNWGGLEHINGAVAQADILGIFGREGLDMASLWDPPGSEQPGAFAFRMYRNYDGLGSKFGDLVVDAASANADEIAIFAARRRSDGAYTMMLINKSRLALTTELAVDGVDSAETETFRYSDADLSAIQRLPNTAITNGRADLTLPAQSITLLVLNNP